MSDCLMMVKNKAKIKFINKYCIHAAEIRNRTKINIKKKMKYKIKFTSFTIITCQKVSIWMVFEYYGRLIVISFFSLLG